MTYDAYYDEVVRLAHVGHETIAIKCDEAMIVWIKDVLQDPASADYYDKTWSLSSGYGRFPVVYGGYGDPPPTKPPRQDGKISA